MSWAAGAQAATWQDNIVTAFATPSAPLTVAALHKLLTPFGRVEISPACGITPGPAAAGSPGIAAMTLMALGSCADSAAVSRVQLLLQPVDAPALASLRHQLLRAAGQPCFAGIYPANPRRRAPPLHFTAWSGKTRDLVLTEDETVPDGVSITFLRNDLHTGDKQAMAAYADMRDTAHDILPSACQTTH